MQTETPIMPETDKKTKTKRKTKSAIDRQVEQNRKEFGELIKAARLAAGWTSCYGAAMAAGIHTTQMFDFEHGRRIPTYASLYNLVSALNLDPAHLFPQFKPKAETEA